MQVDLYIREILSPFSLIKKERRRRLIRHLKSEYLPAFYIYIVNEFSQNSQQPCAYH